ncbi:MAG: SAM-dependent methyltransferase [Pseudomonadota bacterium]|nr:SAM-dependent methyltransferase [Pseudomonadota bacterium]
MKSNLKFFKNKKSLPVDKFLQNVLYDKKFGYYSSKVPFGEKGDFITAPTISNLFSELISIWIISTWEKFGKPEKINIVELGPGNGSLIKILLNISRKFPKFNSAKNIFLYETSNYLRKIQKTNIKSDKVRWIKNFQNLNDAPVIFFGNEFFDAIPIKQFKRKQKKLYEKNYFLNDNYKIGETLRKAKKQDLKNIQSFKILKNLKFIEFPKSGFNEMKKIIKTISKLNGCLLMIDYGYLKPNNQNTLQSVINNKKNQLLKNLGKADITSHVNFSLLKEFFLKNRCKVKKVISQKEFLINMGINTRAEIIAKRMKFRDQANLYLRLKRLLSPKLMGELFKVICVYKCKNSDYLGFN